MIDSELVEFLHTEMTKRIQIILIYDLYIITKIDCDSNLVMIENQKFSNLAPILILIFSKTCVIWSHVVRDFLGK